MLSWLYHKMSRQFYCLFLPGQTFLNELIFSYWLDKASVSLQWILIFLPFVAKVTQKPQLSCRRYCCLQGQLCDHLLWFWLSQNLISLIRKPNKKKFLLSLIHLQFSPPYNEKFHGVFFDLMFFSPTLNTDLHSKHNEWVSVLPYHQFAPLCFWVQSENLLRNL